MLKSHSRMETENGIASIQQWVNLTMAAIKPFPTQRNRKSTERNEFDMIFGKSECFDFCLFRGFWTINWIRQTSNKIYMVFCMLTSITFHISHFYSTFENTPHCFIVCRAFWWRFSFIRCSETVSDFRISERGGFALVLRIINGKFCVGYSFWNRIECMIWLNLKPYIHITHFRFSHHSFLGSARSI